MRLLGCKPTGCCAREGFGLMSLVILSLASAIVSLLIFSLNWNQREDLIKNEV
jgi:hypothetical protein